MTIELIFGYTLLGLSVEMIAETLNVDVAEVRRIRDEARDRARLHLRSRTP